MAEELKTGSGVASPECQEQALLEEAERQRRWQENFCFLGEDPELNIDEDPGPIPSLLNQPDGETCFIPDREVGMIAATGGLGKSTTITDLAVSVTAGIPWLGKFPVARPGRTLLMLAEESGGPTGSMKRLLRRIMKAKKLSPDQEAAVKRNLVAKSVRGVDCSITRTGWRATEWCRASRQSSS